MIRGKSLIFTLFIISVSGVSAKSPEADVLSLIAAVSRDTAVVTADTVPDYSAILTFLVDDQGNPPSAANDFSTGLEALTAITDAYSEAGYYSSGAWVRDEYKLYPSGVVPPVSGVRYIADKPVVVTSPFGYREARDKMHYGMDLSMCTGDSVRVSMTGTVSSVRFDPRGYGHYIIIVHDNGLETRYAHLACPLVESGNRVTEGSVIALSGSSGNSTGPHLHLETRYRGVPVDPMLVFDFK